MKFFLVIIFFQILSLNTIHAAEIIKIPVEVYILDINVNGYKTKTSNQDIKEDIKVTNEIWGKANIFWDLKKISIVKADVKYFKNNRSKIDSYTRKTYHNNKKARRDRTNFWLTMFNPKVKKPISENGVNIYYIPKPLVRDLASSSAIMRKKLEQQKTYDGFIILSHSYSMKKRRGAILAHELGHHMKLKHPKDFNNTSNPNIMAYGESTEFTKEQIRKVMGYSKYFLVVFR